jgi:hypothetical protein
VTTGAAPHATAHALHVAPHGHDNAAGTAEAPFATLEKARDTVRELKNAAGPEGLGPVTIYLHDGVYRLKRPLILTPEDSGTADAPVTYETVPGVRPIISGGRRIEGWRRHNEHLWVADVPWLAQRNQPLTQLFVNGVRRTRARTPNAPHYAYTKRLALNSAPHPVCLGMTFRDGDLRPWDVPDDRVVCLFHNWVNSYNRVSEADWARRRLTFARPAGVFFLGPSIRYYVENAFEYLDSPGEWFADRKAGKLYYYPMPDERPDTSDVVAPFLVQTLLQLQGDADLGLYVEHVAFRGLSFQHTDADLSADYPHSVQGAHTQRGAVFGVGVRHTLFEDCEFTRLGEHALSLRESCADNVVRRCHMHDLGGGGVYLSAGAPKRRDDGYLTARTTVENNIIHDGGLIFRASCGVFLGGSASYNRIVHNEICDMSWMGVHLGWSWTGRAPAYTHHNEVAYNHIHHLGNGVLNDIGGIYTLGVSPGTVLHHNLIHDITRFERGSQGYGGWGIYLDAGSSEILVENNVVYNTRDGGLHLHCYNFPYGDRIINNIFAFADTGQLMRNANHEPDGNHANIERNIVYNADPRMLSGNNWKPDSHFTSDRNCFFSESGPPDFDGHTFAEWQKTGHDTHSIVADPRFVDPANRDFRLRPDSPALELGFQPIDLGDVGVQGPPEWKRLPKTFVHRTFETAPPPDPTWPIREDAEEYLVGETPDGAVAPEGDAAVTVTDQNPGHGKLCMRFQDAADVTDWKPHWFKHFNPRPEQLSVHCMLRNDPDQPATVELEFRDWPRGRKLKTGPHVRFNPDGTVQVPDENRDWETVGTYALGQWLSIQMKCPQKPADTQTWTLHITTPDGNATTWQNIPCRDPDFDACNWFGIVGIGTEPAVFTIDDIRLE